MILFGISVSNRSCLMEIKRDVTGSHRIPWEACYFAISVERVSRMTVTRI